MIKVDLSYNGNEMWLESDEHKFILCNGYSVTEKAGKVVSSRKRPRYYHDIVNVITALSLSHLRKSDCMTLAEIRQTLIDVKNFIKKELEV